MLTLQALCFALLALAFPGDDETEADTVLLTNGKSREGRVVYEDDQLVILRKGSKEKEIERAEVTEVNSRVRHLNTLLDRLDAQGTAAMQDGAALAELAQFARASRLSGEAELLFLAALLADPTQPVALEALGCRERKGHWSYKKGRKWHRNADLALAVEKWKDRWELRTVHFTLDSNMPLGEAIRVLLDAERLYREFFGAFQTELRLLEPSESMDLYMHADNSSFPEVGDHRAAYFDPSDRITHINGSRKPWVNGLVHECVHHLFYMTTQRTRGGKGKIPAWLDEGMAEIFATRLTGQPGFTTFDMSTPSAAYVIHHASAEKPHDISRVLNFQSGDFLGSVDPRLKYAQSYTLVWFLMFGKAGERRPLFMNFLRSAYDGKSSMSDFKDDIEIKSKDKFEEEWFEAIGEMATSD